MRKPIRGLRVAIPALALLSLTACQAATNGKTPVPGGTTTATPPKGGHGGPTVTATTATSGENPCEPKTAKWTKGNLSHTGANKPVDPNKPVLLINRTEPVSQPCWDQITFVIPNATDIGYNLQWGPVHTDGQGAVVPMNSAVTFQLTVQAHTPAWQRGKVIVKSGGDWHALDEVRYVGGFEGYSTFGVGLQGAGPNGTRHPVHVESRRQNAEDPKSPWFVILEVAGVPAG